MEKTKACGLSSSNIQDRQVGEKNPAADLYELDISGFLSFSMVSRAQWIALEPIELHCRA